MSSAQNTLHLHCAVFIHTLPGAGLVINSGYFSKASSRMIRKENSLKEAMSSTSQESHFLDKVSPSQLGNWELLH